MLTYAVVSVYIVWFLLSMLSQIRVPSVSRYRHLDVLGVLPMWALFAHRKSNDNLISYRTWLASGGVSPWKHLKTPRERSTVDAVFNTERRTSKVLWMAAQGILTRAAGQPIPDTDLSYLLILGVVSRKAVEPNAVAIQYKIEHIRDYYCDGGECLRCFVSYRHRLSTLS
jgi:hypothetical protein